MGLILFVIVLIVIGICSNKSNRKIARRVSKNRSRYNSNNENFIYFDSSKSEDDYTDHHYYDCGEYDDHDCGGSDFGGDDCGGGDYDGGSCD